MHFAPLPFQIQYHSIWLRGNTQPRNAFSLYDRYRLQPDHSCRPPSVSVMRTCPEPGGANCYFLQSSRERRCKPALRGGTGTCLSEFPLNSNDGSSNFMRKKVFTKEFTSLNIFRACRRARGNGWSQTRRFLRQEFQGGLKHKTCTAN